MRYLFILWAVVSLSLRTMPAQELRASVSGTVMDPSASPIPNAKVSVRNLDTNVVTDTVTNEVGRYTLLFLQPGRYALSVEASGFKRYSNENVVLGTSDRVSLDVPLEVGQITESVTVTAESTLLQTETASAGSLVTTSQVRDIPNNGRNVYQLVWAAPGVIKNSRYWGSMENYALGNSTGVSINGGIRRENETVMDGVTNTQPNRDVNFQPPLESVAEMKVQVSNYDASYGRFGGGVVAITTKSGTNSLHGSLYEFNKVAALAANPWVYNFYGEPKPHFVNNTFGFQVDGPIYLPRIFDGRNRLFFMVAYEGLRERSSGGDATVLPTQGMRSGDFSGLPVTIYDPLTTRSEGGRFVRDPFPGNRIPANRISPVAQRVLEFVPQPNLTGRGYGLENYANFGGAKNGYDQFLTKLDYRVNDRNNVYFSYGRLPYQEFDDILFGGDSPAEPSRENPLHRNFYRYVFDWTSTLSPQTVLNFRAGLARYVDIGGSPPAVGFDPRNLGFADSLVSQFTFLAFPRFNIGGFYTSVGSDRALNQSVRDSYSYQLNLNRSQGRHQLKYGAEFRIYNESAQSPGNASGTYQFSKGFTQANPAQADRESGDEFAAFLLGYPSSGSVDMNIDPYFKNHYFALFVHDDFKIHPRVTLNLGLRWDYEQPPAERYNRMLRGFAFDQPSPIANQVTGLDLRGGLLYAGSDGDARRAFNSDKNNIQPRVGIAVQLTPKTVLRGGYGLYYLGASGGQPTTGFSQTTPLVSSADAGNTPRVSLVNAFPDGLIRPQGSSQGMSTLLGQGISFSYLDRVLPYAHQYSVGVQRSLPGGFVVDASYSGNETRRYPVTANLNAIPTDQLGQPDTYYREQVPNPMRGLLPLNASKNGATIVRQDLLVPFPQYSGVTMSNVPIGRNHYHSFQVSARKRYSQGLTMNLSYTISKTIEELTFLNAQDFNLQDIDASRLERRLTEYDVPQKFAALVNYELPFGRGKPFGAGATGVAGKLISGWQFSTQTTFQSGFPVDFPNAPNLEARSAKLPSDQISLFNAFDKTLFPSTTPNLSYQLRTWPTRFPDVRLYPLKNVDFSVSKRTPIGERMNVELRADFLNAANHPWFSRLHNNGTDVTRPEFGWYFLEEQNQNRLIALVLKFSW
ncbi:MAG TPA: TonB-dependent receptor [Bryobacteraceae bacterium]|nr:TonB-dependent receptor [Bryobacteraceae bacterium]